MTAKINSEAVPPRPRSVPECRQAARQKALLGALPGQRQCLPVGFAGLLVATEAATHVGAGGVGKAIVV